MLRSLSERDRNRFAQLLQAPLIKPDQSPKDSGVQRFAHLKSVLPLTAMKRHFAAHYRGWATGAAAVAGLAILMVAVNRDFRGHETAIQLKAMDQKGRLQIRWNPDSDAIRRAVAAKLYIIDGSERLFVKLDDARLRLGNVNYARSSGRVELRMELAQPDGKRVEDQATFVGVLPSTADEFSLETNNDPGVARRAPAPPPAVAAVRPQAAQIAGMTAPSGQRARKKSLDQSGTRLPFTCSDGDTFRITASPAGWDTFTCHGKNVWSRVPGQTRGDGPATTPGSKATTVTREPSKASTT
jgi:hypothetical protein